MFPDIAMRIDNASDGELLHVFIFGLKDRI